MADEPEVPRHEEVMEFGKADHGGRRWGRDAPAPPASRSGLDDRTGESEVLMASGATPDIEETTVAGRRARMLELVRRLDHSRALVVVATCIVVTALSLGFVGWAIRDKADDSGTSASAERHGLTEDQAACFAFARIESRVRVLFGTADRDGGSPARSTLKNEIELLDRLASDFPSADYRLIVGFLEVADASVRVVTGEFPESSRQLSSQRLSSLNAAHDLCLDVAHFDARSAARHMT